MLFYSSRFTHLARLLLNVSCLLSGMDKDEVHVLILKSAKSAFFVNVIYSTLTRTELSCDRAHVALHTCNMLWVKLVILTVSLAHCINVLKDYDFCAFAHHLPT